MTKREKLLGAMVGLLLLVAGLLYGAQGILRSLDARRVRLNALESELQEKRQIVRLSQLAADRMQLYERRALPADVQKARSLYQTWLLDAVTEIGFDEPNVNVIASTASRELYHQLGFTLSGRGDLKQLVRFLHAFYAADYLHRIRRLHINPVSRSRQLDVAVAIEALSLPAAIHEDGLSEFDSGRLTFGEPQNYLTTILHRNMLGAANRPPRLASLSDRTATTGSSVSFTLSAEDPDPWDTLEFSMEGDLPGARLDPRSGQFSWRPQTPGRYEVEFAVTDDGWPPRSDRRAMRITVEPPPADPPPPPPPVARPPSFEQAQFAFVTAITESEGRRQAWINLRTEAQTLKLHEGEAFQVGDVPVTIRQINHRSVEMEAPDLEKQFQVPLGHSLAQAAGTAPPSNQSPLLQESRLSSGDRAPTANQPSATGARGDGRAASEQASGRESSTPDQPRTRLDAGARPDWRGGRTAPGGERTLSRGRR